MNDYAKVAFEATRLIKMGISIIPISCQRAKHPALPEWKTYQSKLPKDDEIREWFVGKHRGLAAIGGKVSGGLECIDFDEPAVFEPWCDEVNRLLPGLLPKTVIVTTPSGGYHVWYRCSAIDGNHALAERPPTAEELATKPNQKKYVMIETRGEGGYALLPGSPKEAHGQGLYQYSELGAGDLAKVPMLTPAQREQLHNAARALNRYAAPDNATKTSGATSGRTSQGMSPGEEFEAKGPSWEGILAPAGWTLATGDWEYGRVTRPGKDQRDGCSATIGHCRGPHGEPLLHVFSGSTEFEAGKTYGKFRAYAIIRHKGDLNAAARQLRSEGFGVPVEPLKLTPSGAQGQAHAESKPWENGGQKPSTMRTIRANELCRKSFPVAKYNVDGLMSEGLTILAGKPKAGKSWLSLLLAWAVASGNKLDGREVEQGEVLCLALEDTERRLKSRMERLSSKLRWTIPESLTFACDWPRASEGGLDAIHDWIVARQGKAKLVIIDTLAKFRPPAKAMGNSYSEDYESLGGLKKLLDHHGVSGIIVHHTRKMKSMEDPFDDISGTLALSGAADGIWVLDRDRSERSGVLYSTGRDTGDFTTPMAFDAESCLWILGKSADGIDLSGRLVAPTAPKPDAQYDIAKKFLREFLKDYAFPSKEVEEAAKAHGVAFNTLRKAKADMGPQGSGELRSRKIGDEWWNGWGPYDNWRLRPNQAEESQPNDDDSPF